MTSIEYFSEQIGIIYTQFSNGFISLNDFQTAFNNEYTQAKEMHKQEIIDAYAHGQNNGYMYSHNKAINISKEQYYNQTFKKD